MFSCIEDCDPSRLWEAEIQVGDDVCPWLTQKVFPDSAVHLQVRRQIAKTALGKPHALATSGCLAVYQDSRCVFRFLIHSLGFAGTGGHPVLENVRLFSVLPFPPFYLDDSNQSGSELEENLQVIELWGDTYDTGCHLSLRRQ